MNNLHSRIRMKDDPLSEIKTIFHLQNKKKGKKTNSIIVAANK